jgi:hypothetical protein
MKVPRPGVAHAIQTRTVRTRRKLLRRWEGERILRRRYLDVVGTDLDTDNPKTFTDKLYCRMIDVNRRGDAVMTALSDKYLVRDYVAYRVGAQCLPNLYWHGTEPAEVPFDNLPRRYVLKTNHGCGQVIKVDGAPDRRAARARLARWLRSDYYWESREYQYSGIRPRILAEEYVDDGHEDGPLDYRFYCFEGEPALIQVGDHSHSVHHFYDLEWKRLSIRVRESKAEYPIERPASLALMTDVARQLSMGLDFVRVDLYGIGDRALFGEMTFTPNAGFRPFQPKNHEYAIGELWNFTPRQVLGAAPGGADLQRPAQWSRAAGWRG